MLKIIVVDDEALYRKYLIQSVEWEKYGFEICGEAKNGLDALEKMEVYKPDIALVDINMPFMDGLELVVRIKEKYSHIAIILVTGHSEFDYARKAIKLGVFDYILKPFNNDELMVPLLRIKEMFEKNRMETVSRKEERELIKERLLSLLISNEYMLNDEEMRSHLSRLGIYTKSELFQVAIVEIDKPNQVRREPSDHALWQFALANIVSEIISVKGQNIVFNGPEGRVISILEFDNEVDLKEFNADQYQRLCEVVKKYLKFTITVGVGRPARGYKAVHSSYIDALVAIQNKMIMIDSKVIEYAQLESIGMNRGFYPSEIHENLLKGLKMNDQERINNELSNVFTLIKERRISADYTITIFAGLVSLCLSHITELGKSIEDVFGNEFSPYAEIKKLDSLDSSFTWFTELFGRIIIFSNENKLTKSKILVKKVIDYINNNLQDNELDLEMISKNVFINSSYLTKTFKKETGMTITNYITDVRMQKAKNLLLSNNSLSISRIAEMIGYSDVSYFSKSFKKYTGISPSEYENTKSEK